MEDRQCGPLAPRERKHESVRVRAWKRERERAPRTEDTEALEPAVIELRVAVHGRRAATWLACHIRA